MMVLRCVELVDGEEAVNTPARPPLADGFDLPVGAPDGKGYHITRAAFGTTGRHTGEDWNGNGGADSDLGDPVYATADGVVVFSADARLGHGNVIILQHVFLEKDGSRTICESSYHHLHERLVEEDAIVKRGQKIGTMGNNRGMYPVHLHFELRKTPGMGLEQSKYEKSTKRNYWIPSDFIREHRPALNKASSTLRTPPAMQMRWVAESASAETEELELRGGSKEKLHVQKAVQLDASQVRLVGVVGSEASDQPGSLRIALTLTQQGAALLAQVTREGKGRRLAILLGGQLWTAPLIREEITGGTLEISGNFTEGEAKALADAIRACIPSPANP
jgi:hypothetical protein